MSLNYGLGKTNCLTYIPNDIKLSVADGKLTLKAGSKVYVPNGFNEDGSKRFDEVIVPSDKGCGPHLYNNSNLIAAYLPSFGSLNTSGGNPTHEGTTLPEASASGYTYSFFYNTSENKCYHSTTSGDTFIWVESSLPIGIVTRTAEVGYTTINQVFNGFGYIGSTHYILPGVKGLVSNGWNEDGTYKNKYIVNDTISMRTYGNITAENRYVAMNILNPYYPSVAGFMEVDSLPSEPMDWVRYLVKPENKIYTYTGTEYSQNDYDNDYVMCGTMKINNGVFTEYNIFPIQTTNESANIESIEYGVGKTNCLTELPNDIKYSLTLSTLKVSGTPTVTTSGVASNLSGTSYFTTNKTFSPGSNTWEIGCKFKYVTADDNQVIFDINDGTTNYRPITCYAHNDDYMRYGLSSDITAYFNGGETKGKTLLVNGTTYWLKAIFDGSKYTFNLSTDGNTWIEDYSYESTTKVYSGLPMQIGWWKGGTAYNRGSIYLNECYIKYNDVEQWRGRLGSITIKKGSKLYFPNGKNNDGTNRFDEIVLEKDTNTYTECNTNVCPLYLNINANTIFRRGVGNIADVEANKLTNGAFYATDTNKFYNIGINSDGSTYEYLVPFPIAMVTTGYNGITSAQVFNGIGYINNIYFTTPGIKYLEPNGWNEDGTYKSIARKTDKVKISWKVETTGTVTNRAMCITNGVNEADWMTLYEEVQSKEDATANWIYIKDENNIYPKSSLTVRAPRTKIGTMQVTDGKITNFKVDAIPTKNDTYPIKEIHQCVGKTNCLTYIPNDIKIEYNPTNTILNGIITNDTNSNVWDFQKNQTTYLKLNKTFTPSNYTTWEFVQKWNIQAYTDCRLNGTTVDFKFTHLKLGTDGTLSWYISSNGSSWDVCGGTNGTTTVVMPLNQDIWVKQEYNGSEYILSYSTDGSAYTTLKTITSTAKAYEGLVTFGNVGFTTSLYGVTGKIHIPSCYIKANGNIFWQGGTGKVTLKKGSKVYKPDGSYIITENDMTQTLMDNVNRFYYIRDDNNYINAFANSSTGTAPTITSGNEVIFNTSNNHIELYVNGSYVCDCSLPIFYGNANTNVHQPFNGIGFIGQKLFILPGVKGLIPNGWNEDGTYKNIQYESKSVAFPSGDFIGSDANGLDRYLYCGSFPNANNNMIWGNIKTYTYEQPTEPTAQEGNVYWIDTKNNIIKYTNNQGQSWVQVKGMRIGEYKSVNSKVTSFSVYPIPTKNNTRIIYKK